MIGQIREAGIGKETVWEGESVPKTADSCIRNCETRITTIIKALKLLRKSQ